MCIKCASAGILNREALAGQVTRYHADEALVGQMTRYQAKKGLVDPGGPDTRQRKLR